MIEHDTLLKRIKELISHENIIAYPNFNAVFDNYTVAREYQPA